MSTASIAAVVASTTAIQVQRAKTEACKEIIHSYKTDGVAVAEMKQYAECVRLIYPDELTSEQTAYIKIAIVLVFAGMAIGGWMFRREGIADFLRGTLTGFISALMGIFFLAVCAWAIRFLFT